MSPEEARDLALEYSLLAQERSDLGDFDSALRMADLASGYRLLAIRIETDPDCSLVSQPASGRVEDEASS